MMRRGHWKCNYYHNEPPELFNLDEDPDEMVDRSNEAQCKAVLDEMLAEIIRGWDPEGIEVEARRLRDVFKYLSEAPSDPKLRAQEYWSGPVDYGCVNPV
jgi:hypothetical protein